MKAKLRSLLDQTASWAEIRSDGSLTIEFYDFSVEAQEQFGNDVAFTAIVLAKAKAEILHRLSSGLKAPVEPAERDRILLSLLQENFVDYHAVRRWLDGQAIPYDVVFEPWA